MSKDTLSGRVIKLRERVEWLVRVETKAAAWVQLSQVIVIAAFVLRWELPEYVTWKLVACLGGAQTLLLLFLMAVSHCKYRAAIRHKTVEADYLTSQGA